LLPLSTTSSPRFGSFPVNRPLFVTSQFVLLAVASRHRHGPAARF
jgi:hypothetical protein